MKLQFRYLFMAALAHVLLIVLLVAVVDMSHLKLGGEKKQQSIQMRLADGPVETTSQRNEKQAVERKRIAEQRAREEREAQRRSEQEAKKKAAAKAEQLRKQAEVKRQAVIAEKKKAELEKQRLAKKKQAEADKRLAEEKRLQQARAAEKKAAEEKRRKDAAEKARADAERKRKADELAKKKAAERKRAEAAAAAQLAAEQQAFADSLAAEETERELNSVRSAWGAAIKRRVTDNWKRPYTNLERIECDLEVTLMASGEVLEAKIVRSSGDVGIDESVKKALLRSSPLPLPSDMRAFQKEIIFEFRSN